MEEWKDIEGFEGLYQVSDMGQVRSVDRFCAHPIYDGYFKKGRILKPGFNGPYYRVNLQKDGVNTVGLIHRLVAAAFIPNPENKPEVNHKKGIHTDNRASELEWSTGQENCIHSTQNGFNKGPNENFIKKHGVAAKRFNQRQVAKLDDIGNEIERFDSVKLALISLNKNPKDGNINRAIKTNTRAYGYKWKELLPA